MKKMSFFHSAMATLMMAAALTACSSDDEEDNGEPQPPVAATHYDLTVTTEKHGGMSRDKVHYTQSVNSLSDPATVIDFEGKGAEISDYTMESIYKGKYMYQVPNNRACFSKLQFKNNQMEIVQERPFEKNTYSARSYTHAWLDDNTLVIMASNGDNNKVIWTKLNTDKMTIIDENELAIPAKEGYKVLTTSGMLTYRKSDNKLFYFYYWKTQKRNGVTEPNFHIAVINAETMAVEQDIPNKEAEQMQGSAYGELLQQTIFFDDSNNLYISAFSDVNGENIGRLLRIKNGEYDFEAGYNAFPEAKGKLLTVQYLGKNKVLAYSGDASKGTSIDSEAYYYSIIDLATKSSTRLAYDGAELPVSGGSFSQRSAFNSKENKAYFAIDTKNTERPCIYSYDVASGKVSKGASLAAGYYFEQIRIVED